MNKSLLQVETLYLTETEIQRQYKGSLILAMAMTKNMGVSTLST